MGIGDEFQEGLTNVSNLIGENPLASAAIAGGSGLLIGGAVGAAVASSGSKTSRRRNTRKRGARSRRRDRMFKSKQKHERKYKRKRKYKVYGKKGWIHPKGKRKKASSRRGKKVYYTKNGQPYIKLRSGKARFIKRNRR